MYLHVLLLGSVAAGLVAAQTTANSTGNQTGNDPCAAVASSQLASLQSSTSALPGDIVLAGVDAETAWRCVQSIPFHAQDSLALLNVTRQYWSFQTTLSYLKDPPASYQQPAIDVMDRLSQVETKARGGNYKTQYDFDLDLFQIAIQSKEGHLSMEAGVLGVFQWFLPNGFTSVSSDGKALPQIYALSDVENNVSNASSIKTVNNKPVMDFLHQYADTSYRTGGIEPHTDFNMMMFSPGFQFGEQAGELVSYFGNGIQQTSVYQGSTLNGTFQNASHFEWSYIGGAIVPLSELGLTSGQAIYSKLVAPPQASTATGALSTGLAAATSATDSGAPKATAASSTGSQALPSFTKVPYAAYPDSPDVLQDQFGTSGTVSGYLLKDISVGVLSLPSFDTDEQSAPSFSTAVDKFIQNARAANIKKIVIDLTGNGGGSVGQDFDTFKRFFPTIEPSQLFRGHASKPVDVLGKFLTSFSNGSLDSYIQNPDSNPKQLSKTKRQAAELVYIDSSLVETSTGSAYHSWEEFFGPVSEHGDTFTHNSHWNISGQPFTENLNNTVAGYGNNLLSYSAPWAAKDIILLTDGICASACASFAEMMKTDAGVRSIVVGGVPEYGPMQALGNTRGSLVGDFDALGEIVASAAKAVAAGGAKMLDQLGLKPDDLNAVPPPLQESPIMIRGGGFNALDTIRAQKGNGSDVPLQFVYEAADCRMFYTGAMVRDMRQLWQAAAKFAGGDDSMCVRDSTGQPGSGQDLVTTNMGLNGNETWKDAGSTNVPSVSNSTATNAPTASPSANPTSKATGAPKHNSAIGALSPGRAVGALSLAILAMALL